MRFLLAVDQGTTGTTAVLADEHFRWVQQKSIDFPQYFPRPGWVEHDLHELWGSVIQSLQGVIVHQNPLAINAIGLSNQRETLCFWDRHTLEPLAKAIVWQDRRSAPLCQKLKKKGLESLIQKKTGLLLDPYFSGTKIAWALKHLPVVQEAKKRDRLALGTVDTFLLAKLTGGKTYATEPSNASRTLCYHLTDHVFDPELCALWGLSPKYFPEVRPSVGFFGKTKGVSGLPDDIPITAVLGDQQAALWGQHCFEIGLAKATYGTGSFILVNTGNRPVRSQSRLLTTIAWQIGSECTYALEGSAFVAGAAIQWLQEGLGLIQHPAESELLAQSVSSSEGVSFIPALTGLGAPFWNPEARGLLSGFTRGTTRAHVVRAVLEGIAFQNYCIFQVIEKDLKRTRLPPLKALHVDGGASLNAFLMQFQSNLLQIPLKRPTCLESTSMGVLFAAALGAGLFEDQRDCRRFFQEDKVFIPQSSASHQIPLIQEWKRALQMVQGRNGQS